MHAGDGFFQLRLKYTDDCRQWYKSVSILTAILGLYYYANVFFNLMLLVSGRNGVIPIPLRGGTNSSHKAPM